MSNKIKIILGVMLISGLVFAATITKFYGAIDMQNHKITNVATPTANADATTKEYVDTQVSSSALTRLPLSGGTMSGAINMSSKKITNLATPTAAQDAANKTYVDTAILSNPSLVDAFMFYTVGFGGVTNEARIFNVASTGSYINVTMLADNAGGTQSTLTAETSEETDTATIVRNGTTMKAGSGFKVWLESTSTNDHFTSVRVRDAGDGAGVALAKVKYIDLSTPDWNLIVCNPSSYPATNHFSYTYSSESMYDVSKAYWSGMFLVSVGITNITGRTLTFSLDATAKGFAIPSTVYNPYFVDGQSFTVPAKSCAWCRVQLADYTNAKGASIVFSVANGENTEIRNYRTFWAGELP